jgi:4-amino-4-deoxy-L-arabinose transferase-like glycosyltransferase
MPGFLVPTFAALVAALLATTRARPDDRPDPRAALLLAMLITGLWAAAGAELLGIFGALRPLPVLLWWSLPALGLAALAVRRRASFRAILITLRRPDPGAAIMIAITTILLLLTGYAAARLPTNTWDCWTYHLPRQYYWIQQRSLAHFPAHDLRQLEMPPFAEVLGVHWMLLAGGEAWNNMGQWFALLGCAIAASLAARELGAAARGQSIAALLTVTNPGTIVQSMNAKNDVALALWVLTLAWLGARIWRQRRCTVLDSLAIGAALGLALYTKGTAYIIVLPVCAAIGLAILRLRGSRGLLTGLAIVAVAAAINLGHWSRNHHHFGSPLGLSASSGGYKLLAEAHGPRALASGIIKNTAAHLALPGHEKATLLAPPRAVEGLLTFGDRWNTAATRFVADLHERLSFDPNDPRTSSLAAYPFEVISRFAEDGNSTSPAHAAVALLLLAIAVARPRAIRDSIGWLPFAIPFAAWIAFAVMLRWQPWQFRLEIPLFALLAPVAGSVLPRIRVRIVKSLLLIAAAASGILVLCINNARPLLGENSILTVDRDTAAFQTASWIREPVQQLESRLREFNPQTISHALGISPFETFFLRIAHRTYRPGTRAHPLWANFGPKDLPIPDLVVAYDQRSAAPLVQPRTGAWFLPVAEVPPFRIYTRAASDLPESDLPAFYGWKDAHGLDRPEGPYPQWNLPVVRWARGTKTTLTFDSAGGRAELLMECRRNDRPDQALTIRVNSARIHRFEFGSGWAFFPQRLEFDTAPGLNTIEIEYDHTTGDEKNGRAVLYRRLQILAPVMGGLTTPPPPRPAPPPS